MLDLASMEIFTLLQRGDYHPIYCEDALFVDDQEHFFFGAVMDGCSNGKDSHFASALMGKLLRKITTNLPYSAKISLNHKAKEVGKVIIRQLFQELKSCRIQLFLEMSELLSTLILLVYHKEKKEAYIISLGDGIVSVDHQLHEIDQQNMPDYICYHLSKDFEEWFAQQKHVFHITQPQALAISTDGIESFMTKNHDAAPVDVPNYFLTDVMYKQYKNMLGKKLQVLAAEHHVSPKDDVSMIRLIF